MRINFNPFNNTPFCKTYIFRKYITEFRKLFHLSYTVTFYTNENDIFKDKSLSANNRQQNLS